MVFREAALSADRGRHRRAQQRRQRLQFFLRVGDHHAAAADEHRHARPEQRDRRAFNAVFFR